MKWWKLLGMAGLAGVAATGAVIARDQRHRNAYSTDEIRARIHEKAEEALAAEAGLSPAVEQPPADPPADGATATGATPAP